MDGVADMNRSLSRALVIAGAGIATLMLTPAAPAAAHVTITPTTATAGGRATFTIKVPNERETASTVKVEVVFPEGAALSSLSLRSVPGWTATVQRRPVSGNATQPAGHGHGPAKDVVTRIVWQSGAGVRPGEFQTFDVALGPLPKEPTTLVFKAVQTYSDGEVVRWIETSRDGEPEPEHPAMVVTVSSAGPPALAATLDTGTGTGDAVRSMAGLVVALLALVVATAGFVRRRPTVAVSPPPPDAIANGAATRPLSAGKR
jgi:uncharacterized protein YcnI